MAYQRAFPHVAVLVSASVMRLERALVANEERTKKKSPCTYIGKTENDQLSFALSQTRSIKVQVAILVF